MTSITRGNVFEDLGFSPEDAERMALQIFLGEQIRTFINRKKLDQAKAATFFGVQQPKISSQDVPQRGRVTSRRGVTSTSGLFEDEQLAPCGREATVIRFEVG